MQYDIEMTDTFAGEANYCWVRRATIEAPAPPPAQCSSVVQNARSASQADIKLQIGAT
jgi:hypothetical protein